MEKELFIAIDANAIVHRAFHAYPPTLTTADGLQVNAVFGFTSMLLKVLEDFDPKYIVCAFDTKKPTFRHTQFPEYKATRKPTDNSLIAQFPLVENVLEAFNIPILKKEGYEADDILGTLAQYFDNGKWSSENLDVVIVSGDRDLLQLVTNKVSVALPGGRTFSSLTVYNPQGVYEKYGYKPEQVIDYKAMVGDASDNIPGVKGVGDKSAKALMDKYGSFDEIMKNLDDVQKRLATLLSESVEQAEMSRELATIKRDIDLDIDLESCLMRDFNRQTVKELFSKFQFRTLVQKIPKSINDVEVGAQEGGQIGLFGLPGFEGGSDSMVEEIGVKELEALLGKDKKLIVLNVSAAESEMDRAFTVVGVVDNSGQVQVYKIIDFSSTIGTDCETILYGGEEFDLLSRDVDYFDVGIAAHYLSSGKRSYTLASLVFDYLSEVIPEKLSERQSTEYIDHIRELAASLKKEMGDVIVSPYVEETVNKAAIRLSGSDIGNNGIPEWVVGNIEASVVEILQKMEHRGVALDDSLISDLETRLKESLSGAEKAIYYEVGHEFNINSPSQVADVLYGELNLLPGARSRTTREGVLQKIRQLHPVVPHLLKYRELSKILSTYIEPYKQIISLCVEQGNEIAVHTDFKLLGTSSGRLSSQNPNMQNIPAQGEWAGEVRKLFKAREGYKLVALDYSQIESRLMADISGDGNLIKDFIQGKDIHRMTASRVFGVPQSKVDSKLRSKGKTINFGILYGQTKYGLAAMLDISREEAGEMIDNYFDNYKGVAKYIETSENIARKRGYVESMFGRRRYVPGLKSQNRRVYEAAVREAINMPIQGGDADIMKLAMILLDRMHEKDYPGKVFPLLQIHDEMIYEVEESVAEEFAKKADEVMENVLELKVPLVVHSSIGDTLADLKG